VKLVINQGVLTSAGGLSVSVHTVGMRDHVISSSANHLALALYEH